MPLFNGALECELREYIIFEGDYKSFRKEGGSIRNGQPRPDKKGSPRRISDDQWRAEARRDGMGGRMAKPSFKGKERRDNDRNYDSKYRPTKGRFADRQDRERKDRDNRPERGERNETRKPFNEENPLAIRRNENALKMLIGKKPSLPKADGGVLLRPRRGWKRPGSTDNNDSEPQQ